MEPIPGRPFRGQNAPELAYSHLARFHGVSRGDASDRLHAIKSRHGIGPTERVVIERTGGVYRDGDVELLGSLTARTT
jgi:hypothetical protein